MGVPGMPFACTCSPSLPRVLSSSMQFCTLSLAISGGSGSASVGPPSPLDSLLSWQRFVGSKQCPVTKVEPVWEEDNTHKNWNNINRILTWPLNESFILALYILTSRYVVFGFSFAFVWHAHKTFVWEISAAVYKCFCTQKQCGAPPSNATLGHGLTLGYFRATQVQARLSGHLLYPEKQRSQ